MDIAMVISQRDPEVLWNAFRFGNLLLNENDEVTIFLNGPAVEYRGQDSEDYPLAKLAKTFVLSEGVLLAWGKSLGIHGVDEDADEYLKKSTQMELNATIKSADRVICF